MIVNPPRRPWYQFSLRTMLIVMVLVSAGFGYWVHWSKDWIRQRQEFLKAARNHSMDIITRPSSEEYFARAPAGLWLFGEEGIWYMLCWEADDAELADRLFPEASIGCRKPR